MIPRNLRHLRVFLAVADTRSVTLAAQACHVSQPAITQALHKLEAGAGGGLFDRTRNGFFVNQRGDVLAMRLRRAFERLDPALSAISPRLCVTATAAQLHAVVAVSELENFTLAARSLGLAQPTVHKAISQLEKEAARPLFEKTSYGINPTRPTKELARNAQLAFSELDQAEAEMAELDGGALGRIVIGALPLSRSVVLPHALTAFRARRPIQTVTVIDGLYSELLGGLRRGTIDVILGALRDPAPIGDVVQEPLFDDHLMILARNNHPLLAQEISPLSDLNKWGWAVPRHGTPARTQFDANFGEEAYPASIIETGSILLMREILRDSDHLGCISSAQAAAEVSKGLLSEVQVRAIWTGRPIGLTYRENWVPTQSQSLLLDLVREASLQYSIH